MLAFFKRMLASLLGVVLGGLLLFVCMIAIVSFLIGRMDQLNVTPISKDSLLVINLRGPLVEGTAEEYRDFLSGWASQDMQPLGLYEINEALKWAKEDERVSGLYLDMDEFSGGWGTAKALRKSIADFKESGKPVIAYQEVPTMASYYIATAADEVYLYPEASFDLSGMVSTQPFFKGLLDKLEIEPRIFKVGTHKGLAEPFIRKDLSAENEEQIRNIVNALWGNFIAEVKTSRPDMPVSLEDLPGEEPLLTADQALSYGLVDQLVSKDEALKSFTFLKSKWEDKEKQLVSIRRYIREEKSARRQATEGKSKVAVIFAEGDIVYGEGAAYEAIGSQEVVQSLREIYEDDEVKALVIRMNSGGGSALASDIMWRKLNERPNSLPVVSSVGDVAASGGYYMIANSNYIFAEPISVTGSIGVIGIMFDVQGFMNETLGLTFDTVKSHPYADLGSALRPMEPKEAQEIQASIEDTYDQFITVVQAGRRFPDKDSVDQVAQGKIYTGATGIEVGLIDEIGGLDQAIQKAAELAELEEYEVKVISMYPRDLEALFSEWLGPLAQALMPESFHKSQALKKLEGYRTKLERSQGVLTRMPFDFSGAQ